MLNINKSIKNKLITIQVLTAFLAITVVSIIFGTYSYSEFKQNEAANLKLLMSTFSRTISTEFNLASTMYADSLQVLTNDIKPEVNTLLQGKELQMLNVAVFFRSESVEVDTLLKSDLLTMDSVTYKGNSMQKISFTNLKEDTTKAIAYFFNVKNPLIYEHSADGVERFDFKLPPDTEAHSLERTRNHIVLGTQIINNRENSILGSICVRVPSKADEHLIASIKLGIVILILGLVAAMLFAWLFQRTISQPVLSLANSMKRVSEEQDYKVRAIEKGEDEVALLSKVFNDMLGQIERRDVSLSDAKDKLELRVKERTQELEQKTKELQNSNKELEQFAYVASHDLKEPLRMIRSFTQLIARRYKNVIDDEMDEYIYFIVDGVDRMQNLITDLLALSRVGTRLFKLKEVNFSHAIMKSTTNLRVMIQSNEASIAHGSMPVLVADEVQLIQLLQNLISNAIKFRSEHKPEIFIGADEKERHWLFWVKDNGIGIEKEYAERIFMIFQRLHDKGTYPGTGIGLAICKKVVEVHGGEIWFESELGKGSTFFFTIKKNLQQSPTIPTKQLVAVL
ncbi:MAG: sensor histidine kinase [Chitinophagales bacterium]